MNTIIVSGAILIIALLGTIYFNYQERMEEHHHSKMSDD